MTILLLNQFFWPDSAATSQILTDVARALAAAGHDVDVICGKSEYAAADRADAPPVRIYRIPTFGFARDMAARLVSHVSYLGGAMVKGLLIRRPDLVVTLTTPPLLSLAGTLLQFVKGSRHFIWEMDVYPDIAVDLGVMEEKSITARLVRAVADWNRRRADGILVLGECMRQRMLRHGIAADKLHIVENWSDGALIQAEPPAGGEKLTVLYSGNLGMAHDVETLKASLLALKGDERFRFVFAGGGMHRRLLEQWCAENQVEQVSFRGYCTREELSGSLGEADIGLVTQRPESLGSVVPSKIYGLMAAGRPTLFIGPAEATPARLIRQFGCGWHVECGQADRLTELLQDLVTNRQQVREAGARAREAFENQYDLHHGVLRIATAIGAVAAPPRTLGGTAKLQPQ